MLGGDAGGLPFTQDWSGTGVRILGEIPSSVQQAGLDFSEKVSQAGQQSHWLGGDRVQVRLAIVIFKLNHHDQKPSQNSCWFITCQTLVVSSAALSA